MHEATSLLRVRCATMHQLAQPSLSRLVIRGTRPVAFLEAVSAAVAAAPCHVLLRTHQLQLMQLATLLRPSGTLILTLCEAALATTVQARADSSALGLLQTWLPLSRRPSGRAHRAAGSSGCVVKVQTASNLPG